MPSSSKMAYTWAGGLIREPLAVQHGQQRGLLGPGERRGMRCPRSGRRLLRGRFRIALAVQRRP